LRISDLIHKKEKETIVCQYQEKICNIPKEEIFKIPGLISSIPDVFLPYLVGIQVYKTYVIRFNFTNDPVFRNIYFRPGSLVCSRIKDETVSILLSKISNAKTN